MSLSLGFGGLVEARSGGGDFVIRKRGEGRAEIEGWWNLSVIEDREAIG